MKRGKVGKWPITCEHCGCPGLKTVLDPDTQRIVWGYEALDRLQEEVRILNAIIDDKLPQSEREEAMTRYDPSRGVIEKWCEDTRWAGDGI